MDNPVIFNNLPLCKDLCRILVSIDPNEKKDKCVKSDFQWQLLKTRLLIFSENKLVATPSSSILSYIHVATFKEYLNNGSLTEVFKKYCLKVEFVGVLTLPMYEECLLYTCIAKLAPFWNKVEKYFIEGRYFLMQRGALNAIEMNLLTNPTNSNLILYLTPLRIWLREVSVLDYLSSSDIEKTLKKPFFIDLHGNPEWVHVLPSFKRGHLVYITNRIPEGSTFDDYQQLRRHWKNTYGYRLPEDGSSTIYVGVSFFGKDDYLYPLECVRRGMHINDNENNVAINFAKTIASKADVVCGNRLKLVNLDKLESEPAYMIKKRIRWSESSLAELDSELMNKWLNQKRDFIDVNEEDTSLYYQEAISNMSLSAKKECLDNTTGAEEKLNAMINSPLLTASSSKYECTEEHDNWLLNCTKLIEVLTKGYPRRSYLNACRAAFNADITTDFENKPTKLPSYVNTRPDKKIEQISPVPPNSPFKPFFNKISKSIPSDRVQSTQQVKKMADETKSKSVDDTSSTSTNISEPIKPIFSRSHCLVKVKAEALKSKVKPKCAKTVGLPIQGPPVGMKSTESQAEGHKSQNQLHTKGKSYVKKRKPKSPEHMGILLESDLGEVVNPAEGLSSAITDPTQNNHQYKKPAVLSVSEIENLALSNQLKKANVASLCSYLKSKGVSFYKEKKKEILMEKVKVLIKMENDSKEEIHQP